MEHYLKMKIFLRWTLLWNSVYCNSEKQVLVSKFKTHLTNIYFRNHSFRTLVVLFIIRVLVNRHGALHSKNSRVRIDPGFGSQGARPISGSVWPGIRVNATWNTCPIWLKAWILTRIPRHIDMDSGSNKPIHGSSPLGPKSGSIVTQSFQSVEMFNIVIFIIIQSFCPLSLSFILDENKTDWMLLLNLQKTQNIGLKTHV